MSGIDSTPVANTLLAWPVKHDCEGLPYCGRCGFEFPGVPDSAAEILAVVACHAPLRIATRSGPVTADALEALKFLNGGHR